MALLLLLVPLLILAFRGVRRGDRSVERFAEAHSLALNEPTRAFVTFHLARLQFQRQRASWIGVGVGVLFAGLTRVDAMVPVLGFALAGSLAGSAIAEATRWFRTSQSSGPRVASLERRDRGRYLSRASRNVEWIVTTLLVATAVPALALPSRTALPLRLLLAVAGIGVVVLGRVIGGRVATRPVPADAALAPADEAIRRASIDVVTCVVASLTLLISVFLLTQPERNRGLTISSEGQVVAYLPDVPPSGWSSNTDINGTMTITWRGKNGTTASTVVQLPANPGPDSVISLRPDREDAVHGIIGVVALLLIAWAIGEWFRIASAPFLGSGRRKGSNHASGAPA